MGEFFEQLTAYHGGKPEPLHETTAVLAYEVGRMLEQAMYIYWKPEQADARIGFYKAELMDALAQCELICESLGVNFDEMRAMGKEKGLERFTENEKKDW